MTKPSLIRTQLSKYLTKLLWVQKWGIQDPLTDNPVVNNKQYPPNIATELPIEQLEILETEFDKNSISPKSVTCRCKYPFRIAYIFKRDVYQDFRTIPLTQIENLLIRSAAILKIFSERIDADIVSIDIPQQQNPFTVRPAQDLYTDTAYANDWAVVAKFDIDVEFICDPSEFLYTDWFDIQPQEFPSPDDVDIEFAEFILNGLNIEINRSTLPNVRKEDESTYILDEIIEIP